jgi:hypothetical protein
MLIGAKAVNPAADPALPAEWRRAAYAKPRQRAGDLGGASFSDAAPVGGLLVGLRCFQGTNWGGALRAVQPVYQVGSRQAAGQRCGQPGGDEHPVLAKPGYAVGAMNARAGLVLNAVQLVFYRIDGRRLDPTDSYASEWVGSEGGSPYQLDARGDPILGVFGGWHEDVIYLGIEPGEQIEEPAESAAVTSAPGASAPTPQDFRTWTSADGNFTVEAKLVEMAGDQLTLERRDGKRITVPRGKLSESDIAYVRAVQP